MAKEAGGLKARYRGAVWNRHFVSGITSRMARPWTSLFVVLGLSPNVVSLLSFAISIVGMAVIVVPAWPPWLGAILLIIGLLWDHSDGQVARITGRGSSFGALLDTLIDRWVEAGWVLALGLHVLLAAAWAPWIVLVVTVAAAHGTLYLRWSNVQKDLYWLRGELVAGAEVERLDGARRVSYRVEDGAGVHHLVRTFYLPFAFSRDVSLWILFVATLLPDPLPGLAVFAVLHILRGVEKNWYTIRGLGRRRPDALAEFLDPDYHK